MYKYIYHIFISDRRAVHIYKCSRRGRVTVSRDAAPCASGLAIVPLPTTCLWPVITNKCTNTYTNTQKHKHARRYWNTHNKYFNKCHLVPCHLQPPLGVLCLWRVTTNSCTNTQTIVGKIPSEMEVAPPHKLLTMFDIVYADLTLTLFTQITLH